MFDKRRLAGAVFAHQAHDGPRRHVKIHVVQRHFASKAAGNVAHVDDGGRLGRAVFAAQEHVIHCDHSYTSEGRDSICASRC